MQFHLRGVVVPILTPFDADGELDPVGLDRLVNFLIARGVHGLYPAGTTGEGFLLRSDERRLLAETVVTAVAGRVPVVIHTGAITTAGALELTRHARDCGANAAAIIPPYVYRHSEAALLDHFVTVARSVPEFPILLYNFPAISNNTITADLALKIIEQAPNVVGMKDSSGSLETLARLHAITAGAFLTFTGGDGYVLASTAMGLCGSVSGNANVAPELFVALYEAAVAGDLARARLLQQKANRVRDLLGDGGDLSMFKQVLARRGIAVGDVRPPLRSADPETVAARWRELSAMDIAMEPGCPEVAKMQRDRLVVLRNSGLRCRAVNGSGLRMNRVEKSTHIDAFGMVRVPH